MVVSNLIKRDSYSTSLKEVVLVVALMLALQVYVKVFRSVR